jgi:hypothetical protein
MQQENNMTAQNRIKTVFTLAAVAMAVFAGSAQAASLVDELGILTPDTLAGNNPATGAPWAVGDTYRLAFFTSATTTAESADIADYNAWVQGLADATTVYDIGADEGVTWKVIGSTDAVDARDNTSTNPTVETGCAIFLLDGSTVVANDYADLWDGSIQHIINLTEQGTVSTYWPFTGSYLDGTEAPGHGASYGALGDGGEVGQGNSASTTEWIWRQWTSAPRTQWLQMYALSAPLVIVSKAAQEDPLECQLGILTTATLTGTNPATGEPWANGDTYRFAFFSSATTNATSADISTYNAFVQGLANATTVYDIGADEGATWNVIGSTDAVDARDNTSTNPAVNGTGEPIFLLDGSTVVANDYADLWNGDIQHIIDLTEQGTISTYWPFTGTYWDGTEAPGHDASRGALGDGGEIGQGNSSSTTQWIWRMNTSAPRTEEQNVYALSDPLVVIGGNPTAPTVDAGDDMITWSGEPVLLDPTVVNNSDPVTDLTFEWSAYPANGVVFTPNANVEDPNVTITKATNNPSVVTLTLAVNNVGSGKYDVEDTLTIDMYDDGCKAANADGALEYDSSDFNRDCKTNLEDLAEMAAAWLFDYTATEAIVK